MDKAVLGPPETYNTDRQYLRPYFCQLERDAFMRTDPSRLWTEALAQASRSQGVRPDAEFFVHIPFNESEHMHVLHYLAVSRFFDVSLPIQAMPSQLTYVPGKNESGLRRDPVSALEYLGEMAIRGSSLWNADDTVITLSKQPRHFPALCRRAELDICTWLQRASMRFEDFEFVHGDCVFGSAALLFVAGASPFVVSLAHTARKMASKRGLGPRFLMNEHSRFLTVGKPVYCSDHQRLLCIAEGGFLTFFDLMRPTKYRIDTLRPDIPSFKSFPFPAEPVSTICGSSTPDGMMIAGTTEAGVNIWKYECENQTIRKVQEWPLGHLLVLKWISASRIVAVHEDCDISVISIEDQEQNTFTMDQPKRFVEKCHGDALVLQSLDNTLIKVITTGQQLGEFEIRPDPALQITCCAYAKRVFVTAFAASKKIVIWDQRHVQHPLAVDLKPVQMIYPVALLDEDPQLFALVTQSELMWIDVHGRKSPPVQQTPQTYYDLSGYFTYKVEGKGTLVVSWFTEGNDPRFGST